MAEQAAFGSVKAIILAIFPGFVCACAIVLSNLPLTLTGGVISAPILALAPVYFWALLRPDIMPPMLALGVGLLQDLFSGGPPGVWAGGFLAAYAFADHQRELLAGIGGFGAVLGFASAMVVTGATAYALASLAFWRLIPVAPLLLQCAVTTVFYPLAVVVMKWLHRRFVGAMRNE